MPDSLQSVLFCCDYNSVRSPMAEGIFKKLIGRRVFVQSAGIYNSLEINGYSITVCKEIDVELNLHQVKSLEELEKHGGFVGAFDLAVALTPLAQKTITHYTKYSSLQIELWEIDEPLTSDGNIEDTLKAYRKTRDLILGKVKKRFKNYLVWTKKL